MKDWLLCSLLALLFLGLWAFLPRFAIDYIQPRSLLLYQVLGIVLAFTAIFALGSGKIEVHPIGSFVGILSGMCGITGSYFFNTAMQRGKASVVLGLTALYPLVALVLVFLVFREAVTVKQGAGIAMALGAVVLLSS